ncbi:MAG TPA: YrvL family regulatory protein [Methanocorpusculum sp.]|nr:YrvL family regulatory protein [Methanocorpusculum sp.]
MNRILRKVLTFAAVLICILLVIFGFEFASVWTGIIFAVLLCAISLPLEIFASAIPRSLFELRKISETQSRILFVVLDTTATLVVLEVLDYFMNDVSIMPVSAFIIALILALFSLTDFNEKLLEKKEDNGLLI